MQRVIAAFALLVSAPALAGQPPGMASAPDIPVSHRDRVYAAEQFSNTVSVIVRPEDQSPRRYLAILAGSPASPGGPVQSELP